MRVRIGNVTVGPVLALLLSPVMLMWYGAILMAKLAILLAKMLWLGWLTFVRVMSALDAWLEASGVYYRLEVYAWRALIFCTPWAPRPLRKWMLLRYALLREGENNSAEDCR